MARNREVDRSGLLIAVSVVIGAVCLLFLPATLDPANPIRRTIYGESGGNWVFWMAIYFVAVVAAERWWRSRRGVDD